MFTKPDFGSPLNLEARMDAIPKSIKSKGLFFSQAINDVRAAGNTPPRANDFTAFMSYPSIDLLALLAQCAPLAHPGVPPREGVRRLGRSGFAAWRSSMLGKVMLSVAGRSFEKALELIGGAYEKYSDGRSEAVQIQPGRAVVTLRNVWIYPDCYQVGLFEGALAYFEREGEVRTHVVSLCDVDVEILW